MFNKKKKSIYEECLDKYYSSCGIIPVPANCQFDRENAILREAVYKLQQECNMLRDENFILENQRDEKDRHIQRLNDKIKELEKEVETLRGNNADDIKPGDYVMIVKPIFSFDNKGDVMCVHSVSANHVDVRDCDLARPFLPEEPNYRWHYHKRWVVKIQPDTDARRKLDQIREILEED